MQFESWRIFHLARKVLPAGVLQKIFTQSSRLVTAWAANPKYCEFTARNPLDRCRMLLAELSNAGYDDHVVACLDWMADVVGRKLVPLAGSTSDKGSVDGEIADLAEAMGALAHEVRQAIRDGLVDTDELIRIKRAARLMSAGVDEVLDAAGIKR